jgi:protein SCO1/2
MNGTRAIRVLLIVTLGAAALAMGLTALQLRPEPQELPAYGSVPEFQLTERSGRTVGLQDLRGKVWIADFIFTRCAGPCPMLSRRMASLQKRHAGRDGLMLVSISVDPARDTPEVLRAYAERYAADPQRWWFLTGETSAVLRLVREGFLLGTEIPEGPDAEILHSTRLALVDPEGRIRGYYDGAADEDLERLHEDADRLLEKLES